MVTDVSQRGCSKQGVNNSVGQHVSIAPTAEPFVKGYFYPAQHQPAPWRQGMDIKTCADSNIICHVFAIKSELKPGHQE